MYEDRREHPRRRCTARPRARDTPARRRTRAHRLEDLGRELGTRSDTRARPQSPAERGGSDNAPPASGTAWRMLMPSTTRGIHHAMHLLQLPCRAPCDRLPIRPEHARLPRVRRVILDMASFPHEQAHPPRAGDGALVLRSGSPVLEVRKHLRRTPRHGSHRSGSSNSLRGQSRAASRSRAMTRPTSRAPDKLRPIARP